MLACCEHVALCTGHMPLILACCCTICPRGAHWKTLAGAACRWEKRDAAFALLSLELSEEQLGAGISSDLLEDYRWG